MSYEVHMLAKDLKAGDVVVDDGDEWTVHEVTRQPTTPDLIVWDTPASPDCPPPVHFHPLDRVTVRRG